MSVIDGLNAGNTAVSSSAAFGGQALDHKAFLRLLTAQLTTQDPFNPVDNTQMVAQMAQFSQVAGIAEMNGTLKSIADMLGVGGGAGAGRLSDASSWIGRSMLVETDIATPLRDGSYGGEVALPADADQVTLSFVDVNGAVVHSMDLGARGAGAAAFAWDGKNAAGQVVATGPLKVVATARAGAAPVDTALATWTQIAGLQSPANGGAARLVTGLGLLKPEDAIRLA